MNEHSLKVLEYDKVKSIVAFYAASDAGRLLVMELKPALDQNLLRPLLRETTEFIQILQTGEIPPLDGVPALDQVVEKLRIVGSMLSPAELLNSAALLGAGRRVKRFFQRFEGKSTEARLSAPLLCAKADAIHLLKEIEEAILAAIDDKAEVKDSASPALRKIRKQLARMREEILGSMTRILQDSGFQKVIQEQVITVRDERYVLPLKPNFRQSIQGVVHGQSGSRATLFVEPLTVLEQNNRLAELRMEEREEIERILRELTSVLSRHAAAIEATVDALASIDAVYARARFGMEYDGIVPLISGDGRFRLQSARHPLLVGKKKAHAGTAQVVANTIVLDGIQRALILSGPNAGGKTVVLKTVGLLCLMAQSGLPITAAEGSELPCFGSVFADIGDEQSLEQDLSTFSSHVSQIAEILRSADKDSLVLLDELGSGTEPGEGAGLGAAVLESLIERGSVTVVTTHHNALKLFGSQTNGAVNAAMEFDPETLKPTYRLIPGRPGRSYGLDMASRLGIPDQVIERARSRIGRDDVRLEQLLEQVEADSRVIASERQVVEQELSAVRKERKEAEDALRAAHDEARDVKTRARTETQQVMAALRQKLRDLSRTARLEQAEAKRASVEVEALGRKLETENRAERRTIPADIPDLHAGDRVRIARIDKTGIVLGTNRNLVELEVGGKKIKVAASDVLSIEAQPVKRMSITTSGWGSELSEDESTDRLNIIGLRVSEGLAEVERFLDRATLHHITVVTVIHGIGTGALRTAVTDFLKNHPLIASIRTGEPAEGGAGVSIAELKK